MPVAMHSCRTREHVTQSVRCVECIHARSSSVVMAMLRCSSSVRRTTTWGIARQPASGTSIRASGPEDPAQPNGSHDGDGGAHRGDALLHRAGSSCNTRLAPHRCGGFWSGRGGRRRQRRRASMRTNETAPRYRSADTPRPSGPGRLPGVRLAEHGRQRLLRFGAADDDVERVGQTQNAREVAVPRIGVKES